MKIAELILEYLKALVWPAVVLTAVILFRQRLRDLLERITSFEGPGGLRASFAQKLAEVQDLVEQAQTEPTAVPGLVLGPVKTPEPTPSLSDDQRAAAVERILRAKEEHLRQVRSLVGEMPDQNPEFAIIAGWREFEQFLRECAAALGREGKSPLADERTVLDYALAGPSLQRAVARVRSLRNEIAHTRRSVTPVDAKEYLKTLTALIEQISDLSVARLRGRRQER